MMEMDENISRLVSRYISGEAADEELNLLCDWLEEADEHRNLFFRLVSLSSAYKLASDPELEQKKNRMLARLNSRIDAQTSFEMKKTHRFRTAIFTSAAAVAAVVFLFIGLNLSEREPREKVSSMVCYTNSSATVSTVTLDDGSVVWLSPESSLEYHISEKKGISSRIAELQGKAYFDVCRDTLRPFVVHADGLAVRVLGTRFTVDSHPDSLRTQVMLEQGSVKLMNPDGVSLVHLAEGQKAVYQKNTEVLDIVDAEVSNYVMENFKKVSFSAIGVRQLIRELDTMFGVELYTDSDLDDRTKYEINFSRTNSLEEVLDIIRALTGVQLKVRQE